jgi:hypothetical protein
VWLTLHPFFYAAQEERATWVTRKLRSLESFSNDTSMRQDSTPNSKLVVPIRAAGGKCELSFGAASCSRREAGDHRRADVTHDK